MKKRFLAVLLALCLLLSEGSVPAKAEDDRFTSMEDLADYLFFDCAYMLAEEIEFGYTQSLDYIFADGFPWKMLYSCGMINMDVRVNRTKRTVTIENIEYYPGFKAAQAWEIEMLHLLDEDERSMLAHAEEMVEEACRYAQSPYQVLVNLHDALVERVVFTEVEDVKDGWMLEDTALGALVYGKAECDGYADAFYLLCTLADIPVRMISGHADNGTGTGMTSHMWNLIWWENGWYHADVSWDDLDWAEDPAATKYQYLLLGNATITDHQWTEDHLVDPPQAYTDWNHVYYTTDNTGITYGAYYNTVRDAAQYIVYKRREYDEKYFNVMIDGDYEGDWEVVSDALKDCGLKGSWYIWTKNMGEYTYISVVVK